MDYGASDVLSSPICNFSPIGDNCYWRFPFFVASLYQICEVQSLTIIHLGGVLITIVSITAQRDHHYHLLKKLWMTVLYMLFPFRFPMRTAQILLQPQSQHTQISSSDQCCLNHNICCDSPCIFHNFASGIFTQTNKMICSKHSYWWTF